MKIKLNLLPKVKEKKLRNKKILKFIILQEIMIIFVTILFFGVVKGVNAIALFQLDGLNQQINLDGAKDDYVEIKKYENELKEVKSKISFIKKIQGFDIRWSVVFNKLAVILPEEITLESIKGDGFNIILKGEAKNRDTLIKIREEMQKDSCFKKVDIPLSNMVSRDNINFDIKLTVDEKCLNNYEQK